MTDTAPIALCGAPGSPYTRKMLAVLRYRRIPYRFLISGSAAAADLPKPRVALLPTFYFSDATGTPEAMVNSTPIIRRLEREIAGRFVMPADPVLAFLDALIEDYADEWLTKPMFHYRWSYPHDIAKAAAILPAARDVSISDEILADRGRAFSERQIARLPVVGSNSVTGPLIEASYRRFLAAFEAHLTDHPFLLGKRPSSCDFAVFGQLTQLAGFDPTPMALTLELAPRVAAWTGLLEDLSGLEPGTDGWFPPTDLPATLHTLLAEIGRVYPPVLLSNEAAYAAHETEVTAVVEGERWVQPVFPYQAKCLHTLRAAHAGLNGAARAVIDAVLAPAGLSPLFVGGLAPPAPRR